MRGWLRQQINNCLAIRQTLPRGVERMDLHWTYIGFVDDPPDLRAMRLGMGVPPSGRGLSGDAEFGFGGLSDDADRLGFFRGNGFLDGEHSCCGLAGHGGGAFFGLAALSHPLIFSPVIPRQ